LPPEALTAIARAIIELARRRVAERKRQKVGSSQ
jgi:hypothetical protein